MDICLPQAMTAQPMFELISGRLNCCRRRSFRKRTYDKIEKRVMGKQIYV